jgi:hypothetical protein
MYTGLVDHCAKIDKRSTKYQFDLERDIDWSAIGAPGTHFPPQFLADCGIDAEVLASTPAAAELFQWAFALATCNAFIEAERILLRVLHDQRDELAASRSVGLLADEEEKHILVFRRYADHLASQRPEHIRRFDELFARCRHVVSFDGVELPSDAASLKDQLQPMQYPTDPVTAYFFWIAMLFFEEYTIFLQHRLEAGTGIQPTWLSLNAAHRQEEMQHLPTNRELVRSLGLSEADRSRFARFYMHGCMRKMRYFTGLDTACEIVREQFPALPPFDHNAGRDALDYIFMDVLRTQPAFAATRAQPWFAQFQV